MLFALGRSSPTQDPVAKSPSPGANEAGPADTGSKVMASTHTPPEPELGVPDSDRDTAAVAAAGATPTSPVGGQAAAKRRSSFGSALRRMSSSIKLSDDDIARLKKETSEEVGTTNIATFAYLRRTLGPLPISCTENCHFLAQKTANFLHKKLGQTELLR